MGTRSGQILKFVDDQADDVDRAWVSVQAVTQQDAAAEAALQSLATTFKEVSAQNENVAELMSFANNLREVRTEFAPCVAATEEIALGNMLKLNDLRQSWETVRLNSLTQLQVFVGNLRDVPAWFQPLQAEADGIDNGLAQMALVALAASVARFNQKLAQAESKLRLELSQAVDALVVLSNKTLGRMRLD
jgi:DNA repair ATPase RecN